jgi:hypothetical protein
MQMSIHGRSPMVSSGVFIRWWQHSQNRCSSFDVAYYSYNSDTLVIITLDYCPTGCTRTNNCWLQWSRRWLRQLPRNSNCLMVLSFGLTPEKAISLAMFYMDVRYDDLVNDPSGIPWWSWLNLNWQSASIQTNMIPICSSHCLALLEWYASPGWWHWSYLQYVYCFATLVVGLDDFTVHWFNNNAFRMAHALLLPMLSHWIDNSNKDDNIQQNPVMIRCLVTPRFCTSVIKHMLHRLVLKVCTILSATPPSSNSLI